MVEYPREGQVWLYGVLFGTQVYLLLAAALGRLPQPGPIALTLRYGAALAAFGVPCVPEQEDAAASGLFRIGTAIEGA